MTHWMREATQTRLHYQWPPPEIRGRQKTPAKKPKVVQRTNGPLAVVQVIAMLGTILALVGVGAFGEALSTLLLLQNLLTIAIAYDRYNKSQSKHYFLRKDLLFPLDSPYWKVLNNEGSEYGYRVLLRTNKAAFDLICANVDPDFMLWRDGYQDGDGRKRRGRPNMLDGRSAIAMTIAWLGSDAKSNRLLQMTFGVGHSVQDRDIFQGMRELDKALRRIPGVPLKYKQKIEYRRLVRMSRQLSEHNNRALEGTWRRLRHLPFNPEQASLVIATQSRANGAAIMTMSIDSNHRKRSCSCCRSSQSQSTWRSSTCAARLAFSKLPRLARKTKNTAPHCVPSSPRTRPLSPLNDSTGGCSVPVVPNGPFAASRVP